MAKTWKKQYFLSTLSMLELTVSHYVLQQEVLIAKPVLQQFNFYFCI
jgi:hypothetical protein